MKPQNLIFVFHGTDIQSAENIIRRGIVIQNSPGYFGSAFYVTDDPLLAQSNYAGLTNGKGAVLQFEMKTKGLLDLRVEEDIEKWSTFINKNDLFDPILCKKAVRAGINGVFDNAVGGWAIYNPKIMTMVGNIPEKLFESRAPLPKQLHVGGVFNNAGGHVLSRPNSDAAWRLFGTEKLKSCRFDVELWRGQLSSRYIAISKTGESIGMLNVFHHPHDKTSEISTIWVDPEYRNKGIGRKLETLALVDYPKLRVSSHLTLDGAKFFKAPKDSDQDYRPV